MLLDYNEDEGELWMPVHSLYTIAVARLQQLGLTGWL